MDIPFNNPMYRPPAEADSLILQIDRGCPYNRCTFCGMYKDTVYSRLSVADVVGMIADEASQAPETRRVFLADGDVMSRPVDELQAILSELGKNLPQLARVNLYATGSSIIKMTEEQLKILRGLKLHTLYVGLESGDEETLRSVRKGESAEQMIEACIRAQAAGLKMSVMILLGLGGAERTAEHAKLTAAALNRMQPGLLSALRVVPVPGTELYKDVKSGRFIQLTEYQLIEELRDIIALLDLKSTVFRANHSSNIVPLEARFPKDREGLISQLDALLASGALDKRSAGPMPLWL